MTPAENTYRGIFLFGRYENGISVTNLVNIEDYVCGVLPYEVSSSWPQDALRHTYASYHLSHFRSYAELQVEIGHRDATLLRTRYVDQRGVRSSAQFWAA